MGAFAKSIIAAIIAVAANAAVAQIVCGPYAPFGRVQNADGTWTIGTHASCEFPDPNPWSHAYTFQFPSHFCYLDGVCMQFVGNAYAYIDGHHDRVGRSAVRLVTVDSASLVDSNGNVIPVVKTEVGGLVFPVDQWMSTQLLNADTLYTFSASGTDPGINKSEDTLVINATYRQIPSPPPGDE